MQLSEKCTLSASKGTRDFLHNNFIIAKSAKIKLADDERILKVWRNLIIRDREICIESFIHTSKYNNFAVKAI